MDCPETTEVSERCINTYGTCENSGEWGKHTHVGVDTPRWLQEKPVGTSFYVGEKGQIAEDDRVPLRRKRRACFGFEKTQRPISSSSFPPPPTEVGVTMPPFQAVQKRPRRRNRSRADSRVFNQQFRNCQFLSHGVERSFTSSSRFATSRWRRAGRRNASAPRGPRIKVLAIPSTELRNLGGKTNLTTAAFEDRLDRQKDQPIMPPRGKKITVFPPPKNESFVPAHPLAGCSRTRFAC